MQGLQRALPPLRRPGQPAIRAAVTQPLPIPAQRIAAIIGGGGLRTASPPLASARPRVRQRPASDQRARDKRQRPPPGREQPAATLGELQQLQGRHLPGAAGREARPPGSSRPGAPPEGGKILLSTAATREPPRDRAAAHRGVRACGRRGQRGGRLPQPPPRRSPQEDAGKGEVATSISAAVRR